MATELSSQVLDAVSSHGASPTASHAEAILAAYEGYWEIVDAGQQVCLDDYCEQFPAVRSSLAKLLRAHDLVDLHLSALQSEPDSAPIDWPQPGDNFLDYELRQELGRGAFSRVYLATQRALGNRWVVLKLFKKAMGEARILGPLAHANIVPINSLQIDPARKLGVICMPCVGSSTLQRLLDLIGESGVPTRADAILGVAEDTALPQQCKDQMSAVDPPEVLRRGTYIEGVCHLGVQLADALAFIHKRGICHRDLKPSNVLLKPDGQPMLLDFNLSDNADRPNVRMGGTLPYMSPEQLLAWWVCHRAGQGHDEDQAEDLDAADDTDLLDSQADLPATIGSMVSAKADIFSLGVMFYELLAGTNPFGPIPVEITGPELYHLMRDRQRQGYRPLHEANPAVDVKLAALIESCLELDPHKRPESADALARGFRLRLALGWRRWFARGIWVAIALCFFFASVGIGGAYILRGDPLQEAVALANKGENDLAIDRLTEVLHRDPSSFDARFMRARLYQNLAEYDKKSIGNALADYSQLEKLRPDGRVQACLGYCRQKIHLNGNRGEIEGAIHSYEAALRLQFDNVRIRNNLGRAYAQSAELEKAKTHYDAALRLDANSSMALLNRASLALNLYLKYKDHKYLDDGIADVQHALQFGANPDLHMTGARLHALAARSDPVRNIAPALDHLQTAIGLGSAPPFVGDSNFSALWAQDPFKQLLSQKSGANYKPAPRIVDPLLTPF